MLNLLLVAHGELSRVLHLLLAAHGELSTVLKLLLEANRELSRGGESADRELSGVLNLLTGSCPECWLPSLSTRAKPIFDWWGHNGLYNLTERSD